MKRRKARVKYRCSAAQLQGRWRDLPGDGAIRRRFLDARRILAGQAIRDSGRTSDRVG
jgi:hypothetical protein